MSETRTPDREHHDDPLWYKDAIIYQLHVKAFFDSDNDGIGDFKGLTQRLDYIKDLGVTVIWLMPFYPSPMRDDGYDISEYKNVHPDYGASRDFRAFVRKAHSLGLKVITEPAASCTLAAARRLSENFGPETKLVLIFCGGNTGVLDLCGYMDRFGVSGK